MVGSSLTVHPTANGDPVHGNTDGEITMARKGTGHPTSQCQSPRTNVLLSNRRHSPMYKSYMGMNYFYLCTVKSRKYISPERRKFISVYIYGTISH